LALSHIWDTQKDDEHYLAAAKGAPESIADLCHLNSVQKQKLITQMEPLFKQGLRLIGVAAASVAKNQLDGHDQRDFDFQFVGLLAFEDPIRPSVPAAIKECYHAGIRVCMITGDYPGTACHIAREIGLNDPEEYLTGLDLQSLDKKNYPIN